MTTFNVFCLLSFLVGLHIIFFSLFRHNQHSCFSFAKFVPYIWAIGHVLLLLLHGELGYTPTKAYRINEKPS